MPVLPSYRNQSIDLHSKLTGFYIRATLALNGLNLRICRQSFLLLNFTIVWLILHPVASLNVTLSNFSTNFAEFIHNFIFKYILFNWRRYSYYLIFIATTSFSKTVNYYCQKRTPSLMFDSVLNTAWKVSVCGVFLVHIFPHSGWIRENTDQENSEYGYYYYY